MSQSSRPFIRCWEISSAHITDEAVDYLAELADIATPTSFMFVAFRIPYSPTIGIRLIATPWTDENLRQAKGITVAQLRQEHLSRRMPAHLAEIIHLAGQADVGIVIFDRDAPVSDDLPTFDS